MANSRLQKIYERSKASFGTTQQMKLTITWDESEAPFVIEVSAEMSFEDLKAYLEAETGVLMSHQKLYCEARRILDRSGTLSELGIKDGDMLVMRSGSQATAIDLPAENTTDRIEELRRRVLGDPLLRSQLELLDPQLYKELGNQSSFGRLMSARLAPQTASHSIRNANIHHSEEYDNPAEQARILELIHKERIEENLQLAYDIAPESFVSVNMLYIRLRINGHEALALVDSGAQTTIIHPKLAKKYGVLNLIDERFAAMTHGVGSAKSEGRIHSVAVSLGDTNLEIPCSFTVIQTRVGILFGLDMLKRHKCCIDLAQNALVIGERRVEFLGDTAVDTDVDSFLKEIQDDDGGEAQVQGNKAGGISNKTLDERSETAATVDSELALDQLVSLGFSRDEASAALQATHGNMELAASLLFQ